MKSASTLETNYDEMAMISEINCGYEKLQKYVMYMPSSFSPIIK
jgi:hypothetical protein